MLKEAYKTIVPEKVRNEIRIKIQHSVSPFYYGTKFTCNCCNKSFRKFLAKGNVERLNAKCPYCSSLERTRVLKFYLENETGLMNGHLKVLHVAPEQSLSSLFRKLDVEYIDGDINPANATHIIDITNIPYSDSYFDLIICSHVLGHIPDEVKAIRELRRVLKEDGEAIIMTLINVNAEETFEDWSISSADERLINYGEPDLCRLHGLDFDQRLAKEGFTVKKIDYAHELPAETISKYQLLGDGTRELIFSCTK